MSQLVSVNLALFIHEYTPPLGFAGLCLIITLIFLYLKKYDVAIIFSASFVTTTLVVFILKNLFAVPRPVEALLQLSGYALPSSHAASSMFIATSLSWVLLYKTKIPMIGSVVISGLFFIAALLIGLSRLTLHVHTFFQISVGFVLGILISIFYIYTFSLLSKYLIKLSTSLR